MTAILDRAERAGIDPDRVRSALGLPLDRNFIPSERRRRAGVEDVTRRALQGFVLPTWMGRGLPIGGVTDGRISSTRPG